MPHMVKKDLGETAQIMLLQIPIDHIIYMCLVMHDEKNAFFASKVEQRRQCIFDLDAFSANIVM